MPKGKDGGNLRVVVRLVEGKRVVDLVNASGAVEIGPVPVRDATWRFVVRESMRRGKPVEAVIAQALDEYTDIARCEYIVDPEAFLRRMRGDMGNRGDHAKD